jgi:CRP/FNR family transcriptional regulator
MKFSKGIERLEKLGDKKHFDKEHVIIKGGSTPRYCYIVKKGRVIAYEITFKGNERIYNFIEPNSLFLEANLMLGAATPLYFKTTVPSDLICISNEALFRAMKDDPLLAYDIIESISNKYLSLIEQIRQTNTHSATWNICNLLLIFADRYGILFEGRTMIKEKLSQQMLSNLLGINRITTVRIIKKLKDMKLIEYINGYYCIRDIEKLKNHLDELDDMI